MIPRRVAVFFRAGCSDSLHIRCSEQDYCHNPGDETVSTAQDQIDPRIETLTDVRGATGEVDYELLKVAGADMVLCPPLDSQLIRKTDNYPGRGSNQYSG